MSADMKEMIRVLINDRLSSAKAGWGEFYVTKAAWALILKNHHLTGEALIDLLEEAEAIARQDTGALRINTKYVN